MSSLLKDIYSPGFYNLLTDSFSHTIPGFDKPKFISMIFTDDFKTMELKERMRHTSKVLHHFLPADYSETVKLIEKAIARLRDVDHQAEKLEYMFFPDYIETYGLDDYENSIKALEFVTQFISCEFAVRPFLLKYGSKMIAQMHEWSFHESAKVRRLASEGSRPRLPWAMAIPALKKDPTPILPILENLKTDPSESVRRSVANSINDIAKDHPNIVLAIAKKWQGISKETDAIIKHGSRTLLKQGHSEILKHYGLDSANILVANFEISNPEITVGDGLEFSFLITNQLDTNQIVRIEYAVFYQKFNGQLSKKVFKISERIFQPKESVVIRRRQSFRPITTKKFYEGLHQLSVIVNGEEKAIGNFQLVI